MRVKVKLFAAFRETFGGEWREIELKSGATMHDLLQDLCDTPQRQKRLFDESGKLRRDVKLIKSRRRITLSKEEEAALVDGDVVAMFPPILGG
ncbi:ubiquitin-like small modifier protein 1 [Chloroflexota bacterium]